MADYYDLLGVSRTATADDAQTMSAAIRSELRTLLPEWVDGLRILYGGSVKPGNIDELLAAPGVDGVLVGGASLDPESFARICAAEG